MEGITKKNVMEGITQNMIWKELQKRLHEGKYEKWYGGITIRYQEGNYKNSEHQKKKSGSEVNGSRHPQTNSNSLA